MSKATPRLDSGLIARKGEAAPATAAAPPMVAVAPVVKPAAPAASAIPKGTSGTIAVTVRLDRERYDQLKMHGVRQRQTNQEILVAALDQYLKGQV